MQKIWTRLIAGILLLGSYAGYPEDSSQQDLGDQILVEINRVRTEQGVPALDRDPDLQELASEWTAYLIDSGEFRHRDGLLGVARQYGLRLISENVWQSTQSATASHIVEAWLMSPGHADNVLSLQSRLGGASVRSAPDGRTVAVFQGGSR